MDDALLQIAGAAREEMETFAKENPMYSELDYTDLGGYCAMSSYFLRYLARLYGYRLTLVEGAAFDGYTDFSNHCWIVYNDKIIDITATQFGIDEKVYIVDYDDPDYCIIQRSTEKNFYNWPTEQSPNTFKKELKQRARRLAQNLTVAA